MWKKWFDWIKLREMASREDIISVRKGTKWDKKLKRFPQGLWSIWRQRRAFLISLNNPPLDQSFFHLAIRLLYSISMLWQTERGKKDSLVLSDTLFVQLRTIWGRDDSVLQHLINKSLFDSKLPLAWCECSQVWLLCECPSCRYAYLGRDSSRAFYTKNK